MKENATLKEQVKRLEQGKGHGLDAEE